MGAIISFIREYGRSLTTIDHFVALKGRDACDIILRKIDEQDRFLTDSALSVSIILNIPQADSETHYRVCQNQKNN